MKTLDSEAHYAPTGLSHYDGNPLIEALPPIIEDDGRLVSMIMSRPQLPTSMERSLSSRLRSHCVGRLKTLVMPMEIHLDFEAAFSELLRQGYTARHPFHRDTVAMLHAETPEQLKYCGFKSSADNLTLVGLSGMGKTTMLDAIVKLYPQVIYHSNYQGVPFLNPQIVWLKIECPHNGSAKGLCAAFFAALDAVLGTTYTEKYLSPRATVSLLLQRMSQLCRTYYIGALIIDELQHLNSASEGEEKKSLLNFFVTLSNDAGVPIVMSGTNAMVKLFSSVVRNARRATGMGQFNFDRFHREDDEWVSLVGCLWGYTWVSSVPLTEEVLDTIYDLTQGNTDFLIKLLTLAQRHAISEGLAVDSNLLRTVYEKRMIILHKAIEALRSNDPQQIADFEDMMPLKDQVNRMMDYDRVRKARQVDRAIYGLPGEPNIVESPRRSGGTPTIVGVPLSTEPSVAEKIADADDWEAAMKASKLTGQNKHF